jgi:DNA-binding GntR family transcriptional regulator
MSERKMQQPAVNDEHRLAAPASLQQHIYEHLRTNLISGMFAPGEALSLRRIAAVHGVSPMPVREAVKRLISEGAIELLPNRTIAVPKLRRRDFVELTRVRELLEGHAAELAARRVTRQFVLQLAKKNIALIQYVIDGDMAGAMRMNKEFHFDLYGATQSAVLVPLIEALWMRMGPIIHVGIGRPEVTWSASQHHAALQALELRDPERARQAIELDIRSTAEELLTLDIFAPD